MTSLHKQLSEHSKNQNRIVNDFLKLDAIREAAIDEVVTHCRTGQKFSVLKINQVTKEINDLAKKGIIPQRKFVTEEMVKEYVSKK
ncbi:YpbS family protein [Metabacillus arenae]|uniref:YpbS family protein n=1 Tax=Metabacillus arenae TaxID=2771434 RepID=A0A926NKH8_9BACI|nr:YpbS family protein [Metabacillus arenae]MBD1381638.1 YpbS family protein [Metabacillus arenae]